MADASANQLITSLCVCDENALYYGEPLNRNTITTNSGLTEAATICSDLHMQCQPVQKNQLVILERPTGSARLRKAADTNQPTNFGHTSSIASDNDQLATASI